MEISYLGLILVIGATLAWSGLDTFRKLLSQNINPIPLVILLTLGQIPIFSTWVFIDGNPTLSNSYFIPGLIAVIINVTANLMFMYAVKLSPFSLTIPFLSFTPIFATVIAIPLLKEYPTIPQCIGIFIAAFGALNLNLADGEGINLKVMFRAFLKEKGSVLMTGVAFLWAVNSSVDKLAVAQASVPFHALAQCFGIAFGLLCLTTFRGRLKELTQARSYKLPLLAAVVFCAIGLSLELTAIQLLPIRLVAIMKRVVELNMAMIIGRFIFEEKITTRKLMAIALMATGILIILA